MQIKTTADLDYPTEIDCNNYIEIPVPPKTILTYIVYPNKIYDKGKIIEYENPVLNK